MEYRLLSSGRGVLLTTKPEHITGDLLIVFKNAPSEATAIFTSNENSTYRKIEKGCCSIPSKMLVDGNYDIVVTVLNGNC